MRAEFVGGYQSAASFCQEPAKYSASGCKIQLRPVTTDSSENSVILDNSSRKLNTSGSKLPAQVSRSLFVEWLS